ncbi:MAG: hypothetical protein Q8R15_01285 [Candidatus Micrarchaeota archaeon]|nr:hypothetical protein [Candidatus Micrarchaeota archaeon]
MRINERIEELKKFFHTTDERAVFSVQNLANLVASSLKVPVQRYHGIYQGTSHEHGHTETRSASFQTDDRITNVISLGTELHSKTAILTASNRGAIKGTRTDFKFHVPFSFTKGASKFHFTVIEGSDEKPLLTIAKTANYGEPAKAVITSHSADGHKVAKLLTRRLAGIATQFRDKDGAKLPMPEITLVKGENVKLPEAKGKLTRRETTRQAMKAFEKLPQLQAELKQLRTKLSGKERQTARDRKLLRTLIAKHRQLRGELATEGQIKREQIANHAEAVKKLSEVAALAEQAKFGNRGKTLAQIRETTRRK